MVVAEMMDKVQLAMERAVQRQQRRNDALDRISRHIWCNIGLSTLNLILLLIILWLLK